MTERPFRRIVLLCDAACDIRLEVAGAAVLAARWGAALHGIFVDDENLRRFAALPFGQHVSLSCAALTQVFSAEEMTSLSSARGAAMQRTLSEAARQQGVGWSFGQVRGFSSVAVPSDDDPEDTLIIEAATRAFSGTWRPRSPRDKSPPALPGSILLKRGRSGGSGMVVVVPEAAEQSAKVLATSAAFASSDEPITFTGSSAALDNVKDEIARTFGTRRRVEQVPIDTADRSALPRLIAHRNPALVVLPPAYADRLLDEFDQDVLLVR